MTHDDPVEDFELAEARALAEALESRDARVDASAELDAAQLIAASRVLQLSQPRAAAVLQRVHAQLDARARRRRWRALVLGFASASALASAWAVIVQPRREAASPHVALPAARAALESAQRVWLSERTAGAEHVLDDRLRDYRSAYLASIDARYTP